MAKDKTQLLNYDSIEDFRALAAIDLRRFQGKNLDELSADESELPQEDTIQYDSIADFRALSAICVQQYVRKNME